MRQLQKPLPPVVGRLLPSKRASGHFAMDRFPLLPLEEEGRLNDLPLRENFIERVFAFRKARQGLRRKARLSAWQCACGTLYDTTAWTETLDDELPPAGLVKFHTAHKLTREICSVSRAMAHGHWACPVAWHYTEMGHLVADAGKRDWDELAAEYGAMLMEGLGVLCPEPVEGMGTRGKHVNVFQHLMGYLKNHLSSEDNAYRG